MGGGIGCNHLNPWRRLCLLSGESGEEGERRSGRRTRTDTACRTARNPSSRNCRKPHESGAATGVRSREKHRPAIVTAVEKSGTDLQNSLTTGEPPQPRIEWITGSQYAIVNPKATTLRIENLLNKDAFVRLGLQVPFEVPPSSQTRFLALGAWQQPLPDNLILDEVGCDESLYLAIPPKR